MNDIESPGFTPLIDIEGVFVKLECSNPTGSIKDRIARFMLDQAARRGELSTGDTVVEATSGNTGIALAAATRQMGYGALIFMPEHMSRERVEIIRNLGAEVRLTPKAEGFEGPIRIRDSYRGRAGYFVPDQFANPDNTLCHELTTGREIIQQLQDLYSEAPEPRFFVAGVGTGGTLMGIGRALQKVYPEIRIVAVEPAESAVMSGLEPGEHCIQGIGDGFIPDLVDMDESTRWNVPSGKLRWRKPGEFVPHMGIVLASVQVPTCWWLAAWRAGVV